MAASKRNTKEPPHSIEAERACLGVVMLEPKALIYVRNIIPEPECFYDRKHRIVYSAYLRLYESGRSIDVVTMRNYLRLVGLLDDIGGVAWLSDLTTGAAYLFQIEDYAKIVRELATQRAFMEECWRQHEEGYSATDVEKYLLEAHEALGQASRGLATNYIKTPKDLYYEHGAFLEDAIRGAECTGGLRFGIKELDEVFQSGIHDDLVVIAGKPSSGKTSFLFTIAVNLAFTGHPGYIASFETSADKCMRRLNAIVCPHEQFMGLAYSADFGPRHKLMQQYESVLNGLNLWIDDGSTDISGLDFSIRRHMAEHPETEWIGIDYLQCIRTNHRGKAHERINHILNRIVDLKKKFRIPVFLLSQVNREDWPKGEPELENLGGSSNIERDADIVLFLWPDPKAHKRDHDVEVFAKCAKQRDGPQGTVRVRFIRPAFLFLSRSGERSIQPEQTKLTTDGDVPF